MIFSIGMRNRIVRPVEFVCSRCGLDRTGAEMVPGRWGCAMNVPVLPMGDHDHVIKCDDCGHESDLGVLDVPTTDQLAEVLEHATVAALVLAVRSSDPARVDDVVERATNALRGIGFDPELVGLDVALAMLTDEDARHRLRRLGRELTTHGKQGFLHRITAVAMQGADLDESSRQTLVVIGSDLAMTAPHINGILAVAASHADA